VNFKHFLKKILKSLKFYISAALPTPDVRTLVG